jgi:hypothetical protein
VKESEVGDMSVSSAGARDADGWRHGNEARAESGVARGYVTKEAEAANLHGQADALGHEAPSLREAVGEVQYTLRRVQGEDVAELGGRFRQHRRHAPVPAQRRIMVMESMRVCGTRSMSFKLATYSSGASFARVRSTRPEELSAASPTQRLATWKERTGARLLSSRERSSGHT